MKLKIATVDTFYVKSMSSLHKYYDNVCSIGDEIDFSDMDIGEMRTIAALSNPRTEIRVIVNVYQRIEQFNCETIKAVIQKVTAKQ